LVRRRARTSKRTATSARPSRPISRRSQLDGQNVAAWINWGRLLHDRGNKRDAEAVYLRALEQCGPDAVLMFNLGVLLEDLGRTQAALEAYQSAVVEILRSPTDTTTSRGSTNRSASRSTRSVTSANTAAC
jgi:tetratricopeptide (TPR) repeat protein